MSYNHKEIEKKQQKYQTKTNIFNTHSDPEKPKFYALGMFPYPSDQGLHVGRPEGYTAADVLSHVEKSQGYNVLHPVGWGAFGPPAKQYTLDTGGDPAGFTQKNIETFRHQINSLGFSYNWDREVSITDSGYYKWTQWIFTKFYEKSLAYEAEIAVNWVPELGAVISNEGVIDGRSERGGYDTVRKPMRQRMLKITAYANRLLDDLELVDWPENIKGMQRSWIGRSAGADVEFRAAGTNKSYTVFTIRPDTLLGVTYLVLAPELDLVREITTPEQKAVVEAYIKEAAKEPDLKRTDLAKEEIEVFTSTYAANPANGKEAPIWTANYVLSSYDAGAIMAIPVHDECGFEFAQTFGLEILPVIGSRDIEKAVCMGDGTYINSEPLDGMNKQKAIDKMNGWLEENGVGKEEVSYHLRGQLFSRQRYWGKPIPTIHWEDGTVTAVSEEELPLRLSRTENIKPSGIGESPLVNIEEWADVIDPATGKKGRHETNTMPQQAGSSRYYLRYIDPHNKKELADYEKLKRWLPADIYIGGAEHAVLYLLYARFWCKFLYDIDVVPTEEPFQRLYNQGMILDENNEKISESRGNVVNPDGVVETYGADTLRIYEMLIGLLDVSIAQNKNGSERSRRSLDRVWCLIVDKSNKMCDRITTLNNGKLDKVYHQTVKKMTEDYENLHFNTAISQLMVFINEAYKVDALPYEYIEGFVQLLVPIAPHMGEELWAILGNDGGISYALWPTYNKATLVGDEVEVVFQVNGKVHAKSSVPRDLRKDELEKAALANEIVQEYIEDKTVRKVITVPNKLINIVANQLALCQ